MAKSKEIRNVAIVGTVVIGASWAALARRITRSPELHARHEASSIRRRLCPGKRTRTPRLQDQTLRRYGRGNSTRFDHRVEFIRADHECNAVELQISGTLR